MPSALSASSQTSSAWPCPQGNRPKVPTTAGPPAPYRAACRSAARGSELPDRLKNQIQRISHSLLSPVGGMQRRYRLIATESRTMPASISFDAGLPAVCWPPRRQSAGCASIGEPVVLPDVQEADTALQTPTHEFIPVVRYGRYTFAELVATAAQRLAAAGGGWPCPEDARATVCRRPAPRSSAAAYRLYEPTQAIAGLYARCPACGVPHLGPLTLRDAPLTLAGPAWDVNVDHRARRVCFACPGEASNSPAADDAAVAPVTAPASGAAKPSASGEQFMNAPVPGTPRSRAASVFHIVLCTWLIGLSVLVFVSLQMTGQPWQQDQLDLAQRQQPLETAASRWPRTSRRFRHCRKPPR